MCLKVWCAIHKTVTLPDQKQIIFEKVHDLGKKIFTKNTKKYSMMTKHRVIFQIYITVYNILTVPYVNDTKIVECYINHSSTISRISRIRFLLKQMLIIVPTF